MEIQQNQKENYKYFYNCICSCLNTENIELKTEIEDGIFKILKNNNFNNNINNNRKMIKIDIEKYCEWIYINDQYIIPEKNNLKYYNTILILKNEFNYIIFGNKNERKMIENNIITNISFLRKIKIKSFLNENEN